MNMIKADNMPSIKSASSRILVAELSRRGIKVEHLNAYVGGDVFLRLSYKHHVEHVYGTKSSRTTSAADHICRDKNMAKVYMQKSRLSVVPGEIFICRDLQEIKPFLRKIGYPCVLKKYNGSGGNLVFVGVKNFKEAEKVLRENFATEKLVLVEKEFSGREFRFFATGEKILGIVLRDPANVTGDGKHSIRELSELKNKTKAKKFRIRLDVQTEEFLSQQRLGLDSIIAKGRKVYLRKNSNTSTGGDSVDYTDAFHPEFKQIALRAVNAVPGLAYGGVDIMTELDVAKKPRPRDYVIIEINANPGIFMHHCPGLGKSRDIAAGIVDFLFPETHGR